MNTQANLKNNLETLAVHSGVYKDKQYNSISTAIYATSTFYFDDLDEIREFDYTRSGNPSRKALEENLAALEGGVGSLATSSGMSAITCILGLLKSGDHVITSNEIYGGTFRLFSSVAPQFGIEVSFLEDLNDLDTLKKEIKENTKLVWVETPSNPLLKIIDIQAVSRTVKAVNKNIYVASDNTFPSPCFQKPLELGCDLVMHSTTKYIGGHSDVVGGAVISKTEALTKKINGFANATGLAASPFDSWVVLKGIKTLPLRMKAHEQNALKIAKFLEKQDLVEGIFYPGLDSHPQKKLIDKQMSGYGGMLSFELSEKANLNKFFKELKYFHLAVSLGGVESLIARPWSMSHASMSEEARKKAGIKPNLVRLSAGIENAEDLINDLENALKVCAP